MCIDQHMTNYKYHDAKLADLNRQVNDYPRLRAISHDPEVRDRLQLFKSRDTHSQILLGMYLILFYLLQQSKYTRGSNGCDRMVVEFTTTNEISAYHY